MGRIRVIGYWLRVIEALPLEGERGEGLLVCKKGSFWDNPKNSLKL